MKHLKIYEEFEYMWDDPNYFKNFLKVGDYIVINDGNNIKNEVAQIVEFCKREDYPEYNMACIFIAPENIGCVVGGDGLYYVSYKEITKKLDDHEIAALKYNI